MAFNFWKCFFFVQFSICSSNKKRVWQLQVEFNVRFLCSSIAHRLLSWEWNYFAYFVKSPNKVLNSLKTIKSCLWITLVRIFDRFLFWREQNQSYYHRRRLSYQVIGSRILTRIEVGFVLLLMLVGLFPIEFTASYCLHIYCLQLDYYIHWCKLKERNLLFSIMQWWKILQKPGWYNCTSPLYRLASFCMFVVLWYSKKYFKFLLF